MKMANDLSFITFYSQKDGLTFSMSVGPMLTAEGVRLASKMNKKMLPFRFKSKESFGIKLMM